MLIIKTARFLSNIKVNNFSGPFTLNQLREFGFRSPEISDIVYDQEQFLRMCLCQIPCDKYYAVKVLAK